MAATNNLTQPIVWTHKNGFKETITPDEKDPITNASVNILLNSANIKGQYPIPYRDFNSYKNETYRQNNRPSTATQTNLVTTTRPAQLTTVSANQNGYFMDWLKQNNPELASYLARKAIASKYGISGYVGNAELNMRLWNALKEEAQKTPAESTALRLPVDTTSIKTMASLPLPTILVTPSYSTQTLPGRGGTADISASFYNAANNRLAFLTPRFRTNYFNLFQ